MLTRVQDELAAPRAQSISDARHRYQEARSGWAGFDLRAQAINERSDDHAADLSRTVDNLCNLAGGCGVVTPFMHECQDISFRRRQPRYRYFTVHQHQAIGQVDLHKSLG